MNGQTPRWPPLRQSQWFGGRQRFLLLVVQSVWMAANGMPTDTQPDRIGGSSSGGSSLLRKLLQDDERSRSSSGGGEEAGTTQSVAPLGGTGVLAALYCAAMVCLLASGIVGCFFYGPRILGKCRKSKSAPPSWPIQRAQQTRSNSDEVAISRQQYLELLRMWARQEALARDGAAGGGSAPDIEAQSPENAKGGFPETNSSCSSGSTRSHLTLQSATFSTASAPGTATSENASESLLREASGGRLGMPPSSPAASRPVSRQSDASIFSVPGSGTATRVAAPPPPPRPGGREEGGERGGPPAAAATRGPPRPTWDELERTLTPAKERPSRGRHDGKESSAARSARSNSAPQDAVRGGARGSEGPRRMAPPPPPLAFLQEPSEQQRSPPTKDKEPATAAGAECAPGEQQAPWQPAPWEKGWELDMGIAGDGLPLHVGLKARLQLRRLQKLVSAGSGSGSLVLPITEDDLKEMTPDDVGRLLSQSRPYTPPGSVSARGLGGSSSPRPKRRTPPRSGSSSKTGQRTESGKAERRPSGDAEGAPAAEGATADSKEGSSSSSGGFKLWRPFWPSKAKDVAAENEPSQEARAARPDDGSRCKQEKASSQQQPPPPPAADRMGQPEPPSASQRSGSAKPAPTTPPPAFHAFAGGHRPQGEQRSKKGWAFRRERERRPNEQTEGKRTAWFWGEKAAAAHKKIEEEAARARAAEEQQRTRKATTSATTFGCAADAQTASQATELVSDVLRQLEATRSKPLAERKKIFRDLQRQLHPDKNMEQAEAAKLAFQQLMEHRPAYLAGT
eukprot:TRINITY_DN22182_c0_g1_i2.p1 TRINITY_DN22182_c0_g1~~TRINITY_DN22182_c0_g1_i2.p1  ORF type:complete len:794 (-),score=196.51 TRINITY_DN22182_c0_g1_i2:177-2558(-)